jgi:Zc3h12a-like Ribonuclease NYN domain
MPVRHVIVDGSNLATEGRSMPSLEQLDQAVREFMAENPNDVVTVVVDASFGHRIDPSEVTTFDEAEAAGEVISPPAGAIGRGDAFLLRIAEKMGATVLSNDSFQEFHGDHPWLFDKGRLIGGKPVPGVGWIFMDRTPVRGQKSREVVKEAKRRKRAETGASGDGEAKGLDLASSRAKGRPKAVDRAIARATQEVVEPKTGGKRRRRGGEPPSEPVNEPLAFITFVAAHPLGSLVVGSVLEFSSHGVFVLADGARCYVPLSAMADPPPRRAREVVARGEDRQFVVQAFDPQRRGIELAIPGFARVAGGPTAETVEAEIHEIRAEPKRSTKKDSLPKARKAVRAASTGVGSGDAAPPGPGPAPAPAGAGSDSGVVGGGERAKKATGAKKASPGGRAAKATGVGKSASAKKTVTGKAATGKKAASARKAPVPAPPIPVEQAAGVEQAASGLDVGPRDKGLPARKATPAKKDAPAKKAAAAKKAAPLKRAGPAKRAVPAKAAPKAAAPKKSAPGKVTVPKKAAQAVKSGPDDGEAPDASGAATPRTASRRPGGPGGTIDGDPAKRGPAGKTIRKEPAEPVDSSTDGSAPAPSEPIF